MPNEREFYLQFDPLLMLPFIFLYAETHYRFKYFFSWLRKPEPEIIADIPSRIRSGHKMPVLILIKDADKYPVFVSRITVLAEDGEIGVKNVNEKIRAPFQEIIFHVNIADLDPGSHTFDIRVEYQIGDEQRFCLNDNHRGTSHAPLPVYISDDDLPRYENTFLGEPHAHTSYTSDQVEFAGSVAGTAELAAAMGLDFYAATDHSYDMDDMADNYLRNDPAVGKWDQFQNDVAEFNNNNSAFKVIPGEEVTIRNQHGKNVHCLVYDSPNFLPGSGDGAEKWFRWRSELSFEEMTGLCDDRAVIFAAHPFEKPPFLQRIFIGRGHWSAKDCQTQGLHGLQFINGGTEKQIRDAREKWTDLLLKGHHLTGISGNDAHGNFARFRQVGFPFFTMREHYYHLFGKWFTGVFVESGELSVANILGAIKQGDCYMSNGPALRLSAWSDSQGWTRTGTDPVAVKKIRIESRSSQEFGQLCLVRLICGLSGPVKEKTIYQNSFTTPVFDFQIEINPELPEGAHYVRMEVFTERMGEALSNPIWLDISG